MVNALSRSLFLLCIFLHPGADVGAQPRVGALAIDVGQGDQYGWAVDHQTAAAAREAALRECGAECSVVLTFGRCAAYAADQNGAATAFGWGESYASADGARQRALAECRTRGGSGCMVRVWGCNGPVVEDELGLDRATRRQIQQSLHAEGFNPGGAGGLFGPRTRAAIRRWQASRGAPTTGYLDGAAAAALRSAGVSSAAAAVAPAGSTPGNAGSDNLFWQSIMNSTNPSDFEAYLQQLPNGIFVALARNRLAALRAPAGDSVAVTGPRTGAAGPPASGSRFSGSPGSSRSSANSVSADPGSPIRADETCDGKPAGASCWMQVYQRPGCYVWNLGLSLGATVTWTGECAGGIAQEAGTLTWAWGGNQRTDTGRLVDGKKHGHWIERYPNQEMASSAGWGGWDVSEGPHVNGTKHGHWLLRATTSGATTEGPFVDGRQTGHWVSRTANGDIQEGSSVNGVRHGRWIWRSADGDDVAEMLYEEGERIETRILKMGGEMPADVGSD